MGVLSFKYHEAAARESVYALLEYYIGTHTRSTKWNDFDEALALAVRLHLCADARTGPFESNLFRELWSHRCRVIARRLSHPMKVRVTLHAHNIRRDSDIIV